MSQQPRGYRPIKDYAVIGDCHGAALIARDGDIDWCCLGRFDADPVFFRLLDARRGGFLSTRLREPRTAVRRYLEESNILRTDLIGPSGHVILIDFMPVGRKPEAGIHDYVSLNAPHWLVRCIEVQEGEVTIDAHMDRSHSFSGGPVSDIELVTDLKSGETDSRWSETLHAGDRRFIAIGAGARGVTAERVAELRAITNAYWREWIAYCRYDGQHGAMVRRSALALKLLCYAPTGAIAAAITTSLPEEIGGERNWDYRACWVRDASLMLFALSSLGYSGESQQFYDFLRHAMEDGPDKLLIGYGLEMERELPARELAHLEGYVGSTPVRVGNGAFTQKQWDLYGFVLEGALVYQTLGGRVSLEDRKRFGELVEFMGRCWEGPDQGIWEPQNEPTHFVHSKAMCWAAVDCG
ncbi:MAG: glycoside hydrolase family 15 protein, partial [Pseudomonadota bacterium]|nr:glycoside hydrolase family 15 protein [Pseudomonadota bacterium]